LRRGAALVRAAVATGAAHDSVDARAVAQAILAPIFHRRVGKHELVSDEAAAASVDAALSRSRLPSNAP
jgi:hypothetical protein